MRFLVGVIAGRHKCCKVSGVVRPFGIVVACLVFGIGLVCNDFIYIVVVIIVIVVVVVIAVIIVVVVDTVIYFFFWQIISFYP